MMRGLWRNFVPFLLWWPEVDRRTARADVLAAITGAVVVLPQGGGLRDGCTPAEGGRGRRQPRSASC